MKINIFNLQSRRFDKAMIRSLLKRVLELEGVKNVEVNLVVVDDDYIRCLNQRFRDRDRPTDVLAFPGNEDFLGEIYISWDRVVVQSKEFGVTIQEEISRLVIHGLLHLLGYKHPEIYRLQERYLKG
jgi:probable rRNA maturation factor